MAVEFRAPTLADVEQVRLWRNEVPESLRTPYLLTEQQQEAFYRDVVGDPSKSRWWAVYDGVLVGFTGLTGIQWENGVAEISLILSPDARGRGYGEEILGRLLGEGFGNLGLQTIHGECYHCNPAIGFWERMVEKFDGYRTLLPRRKRWGGQLHDAMYFAFWQD